MLNKRSPQILEEFIKTYLYLATTLHISIYYYVISLLIGAHLTPFPPIGRPDPQSLGETAQALLDGVT